MDGLLSKSFWYILLAISLVLLGHSLSILVPWARRPIYDPSLIADVHETQKCIREKELHKGNYVRILREYAQALFDLGQASAAKTIVGKLANHKWSSSLDLEPLQAQILLHTNGNGAARAYVKKWIKASPANDKALILLIELSKGDTKSLLDLFSSLKSNRLKTSSPLPFARLGIYLEKHKMWHPALRVYKLALQRFPKEQWLKRRHESINAHLERSQKITIALAETDETADDTEDEDVDSGGAEAVVQSPPQSKKPQAVKPRRQLQAAITRQRRKRATGKFLTKEQLQPIAENIYVGMDLKEFLDFAGKPTLKVADKGMKGANFWVAMPAIDRYEYLLKDGTGLIIQVIDNKISSFGQYANNAKKIRRHNEQR